MRDEKEVDTEKPASSSEADVSEFWFFIALFYRTQPFQSKR
jgi:hypothetical protein